ncbi:MAG: coproporphyrinogen III oxidase, partial [Lachnospiraceae bacterium]|nr:coproporphyrinogen III oxidase [Lachnospiraceae bacterium]
LDNPPEHISAYSLIMEEGTPFAKLESEGRLELPTEDAERKMYEETERFLRQQGFLRYEISNYAREGFACRHNVGYWTRVEYLGLGVGAASLMGEGRFSNGQDLGAYLKQPMSVRGRIHRLDGKEQMEEFCFLGLRLTQGISEQNFLEQFGITLMEVYGEVIRKNLENALLTFTETQGGDRRLALTPRGLDLANYVMAQFLLD